MTYQRLLERCTFPPAGACINCAVSGGADSLALLALAAAAGCRVTAFHVDHGLRTSSADEAHLVADAAKRFGAEFKALSVQLAGEENLEARARAARFAVLPDDIVTGHTADDQAETILINLMRGSGLDGLVGMSATRHPILGLRRSETHALCSELDLTPVGDVSNQDPGFVRNRVRGELLPLMNQIVKRDVVPIIVRQSALLGDEARLLDALADDLDPTDAKALAEAEAAIARRAIRGWLKDVLDDERHPPSAAAVERVLEVARNRSTATEIDTGARVTRKRQRLRIEFPSR